MTDTLNEINHPNAGLRALERQLEQPGALALDGESASANDLLAATDGIAVAFSETLSSNDAAAATRRIQAILGPAWVIRDESLAWNGSVFHGVTALPPEDIPPVGKAWALARELAAVDGVQSATPLFAQVAPELLMKKETLEVAADEEGPADVVQRRSWHLEALKVPDAWHLLEEHHRIPGEGVTVAVVDTGYTDHPEIFERFTKINGQPDKVRGIDVLGAGDARDLLEGHFPVATPSHGTSVASLIASPKGPSPTEPDNQDWTDGIAPGAEILPVRVTTHVVLLVPNKITEGIRAAVDAGADVINVSLGLPYYWPAFHAAIRYAVEQGVIVVAASGNYWPAVVYPAKFPEVLAAANCNWKFHEWRWMASKVGAGALAILDEMSVAFKSGG